MYGSNSTIKAGIAGKIAGIEDYDILQALRENVTIYQKLATEEDRHNFPGATEEEREKLIRMDKEEELNLSDCVSQKI